MPQPDPIPEPKFVPEGSPLFDEALQAYRDEALAPCLDAHDVPEHFARLPADTARWGRILGNAIAYATACDAYYRRVHGELYALYTDRFLTIRGKAPDKLVETTVRADLRYTEAKAAVGQAEGLVAEVREILNGLRRKGDALVSLSATRRTEYEAQRFAESDRT